MYNESEYQKQCTDIYLAEGLKGELARYMLKVALLTFIGKDKDNAIRNIVDKFLTEDCEEPIRKEVQGNK